MSKETAGGIVLIALLVAIVLSQIHGQQMCDGITDSTDSSPSHSCDISQFSKEYYNTSDMASVDVKYNDVSYRVISGGDIALPIQDGTCSLVTNSEEATNSIRSSEIYSHLYAVNPDIYRNACSCNAQSVGASDICKVTETIDSVTDNKAIELAAEHDKATLNIIRAVAPAGYKVTAVKSGRVFLSAVKTLGDATPIGETYQVIDSYTCSLKDLGVRVYDYSLVGTKLVTQMKRGVFFYGSDEALININEDFKKLKDVDPAGMAINRLTGGISDPKQCPLSSTDPKYNADLDSLTYSIQNGAQVGETKGRDFIQYITPIKENATVVKQQAERTFDDYLSIQNLALGMFRIHKIPGFLSAGLIQFEANQEYDRGLYFSSSKDFALAERAYSDWKQSGPLGLMLDLFLWVILITIIGLLAYRAGVFDQLNGRR